MTESVKNELVESGNNSVIMKTQDKRDLTDQLWTRRSMSW